MNSHNRSAEPKAHGIVLPLPPEYWEERDRRGATIVANVRHVAEAALDEAHQITVDERTPPGSTVPTLVDLSKNAEMLVAGCQGLGGVRRLLLGSVSSAVAQAAYSGDSGQAVLTGSRTGHLVWMEANSSRCNGQ